jgi:DNA-binding CsgD family transcriptional regulator
MAASADIARVTETLRALGVRRRRAGRSSTDLTGWDALTAAERRIAALVAEGLTNPQIASRQFISRHTVESHLKHIYLKLGITSRVELATLALRQDP